MRRNSVYVLLSVFLVGVNVYADSPNLYDADQYYIAPGIAYDHFSDKRGLKNGAMANLSAGIVLSDELSIDAFYGQAASTQQSGDATTRFYMYSASIIYHMQNTPSDRYHPYIMLGMAVTNQEDHESVGNTTLLGTTAGIGAEYFVNSSIRIFTDIRNLYTFSGGKNDVIVNAGLKFLFDVPHEKEISLEPIKTDGVSGFYQLQERA
ncbi:MAG: porin family protein [Gammaproteobacteria bacterium]|nr:porin family protein [Gammaproteobacteria bacterium]